MLCRNLCGCMEIDLRGGDFFVGHFMRQFNATVTYTFLILGSLVSEGRSVRVILLSATFK
jgi:hypothetical protein